MFNKHVRMRQQFYLIFAVRIDDGVRENDVQLCQISWKKLVTKFSR